MTTRYISDGGPWSFHLRVSAQGPRASELADAERLQIERRLFLGLQELIGDVQREISGRLYGLAIEERYLQLGDSLSVDTLPHELARHDNVDAAPFAAQQTPTAR